MTSHLGISLANIRVGTRSSRAQAQLRQEAIEQYQSADGTDKELYWCPVLAVWCEHVKAVHIFPWRSGETTMELMFGRKELMHPLNTLVMSAKAEERFDRHYFTIIPDCDTGGHLLY